MANTSKKIEVKRKGQPNISSGLIRVIIYMIVVVIVFFSCTRLNQINDNSAYNNFSNGFYEITDDFSKTDSVRYYLRNNWIIVPNITPDMINKGEFQYENYKDYIYATNASITDSIYGWNNLGNNCVWHGSTDMPQLNQYDIDNLNKNSIAYITNIHTTESVNNLYLSISDINGIARIYCNNKYIGEIGGRDLNKTFSFNDDTSDIVMLTPENGIINLMIVVSCNNTIINPGIVSYPIIENQTSAIRSIVVSNSWLATIALASVFSLIVSVSLSNTFSGKRSIWLYILLTIFFDIFYLFDSRFVSTNAIIRSEIRFSSFIICAFLISSLIDSLLSNSSRKIKFWPLRNDWIIAVFIGLFGILSMIVHPNFLGSIYPRLFALLYIAIFFILSLIKIIYNIYESNSLIAIGFLYTSIICLTQMIDHELTKLNAPIYSIIFTVSTFALLLLFTTRFIINSNEIADMSKHLESQVKEKTLYIHEINRDLVSKNKQLIEGEEARKTVLSNVSHDLRTPITAIRGYAELLLSNGKNMTEEQVTNYLTNIVKRSQQMERIVSDIVELTRMESSTNEFQFTDISITELLDEIVMMFSGDLVNTDKHLRLDISYDDMLIVKADPKKLSRVFENLISNAISYTNDSAEIIVKAWRTNAEMSIKEQRIHITISDNGIGIPEEEIDKVFDRFYRAKNSGKNIKGTGLGLSIVKAIIDKHDATISVESKTGVGTTFHIIMKATY